MVDSLTELGDGRFSPDLLQLETRRDIYQAVHNDPGITKTEVQDATGYGWGTIHYHLGLLSDEDLIKTWRPKKKVHFFDHRVQATDFAAICALRQHLSAPILSHLQEVGEAQMYELARDLDASRKVIRGHLAPLHEAGLLEKIGEQRPRYRLTSSPEFI